jgi:hypothetical protein
LTGPEHGQIETFIAASNTVNIQKRTVPVFEWSICVWLSNVSNGPFYNKEIFSFMYANVRPFENWTQKAFGKWPFENRTVRI